MRQARHRNLGHAVEPGKLLLSQAGAFVADHQHGAAGEGKLEQSLGAGRLFEAHDLKALGPEPIEHRREAAMHLEGDLVGPARAIRPQAGGTAGDHPADAEAAAGSYDMREIHVAPHRRAGHDEPAGDCGHLRRLVTNVFEPRHRLLGSGAAALVGLAMILAGCGAGRQGDDSAGGPATAPATPDSAAAAPAAAPAVTLRLVDHAGLMEEVERHRGKVVVLDCWSTSCPPCVKEFRGW